MVCLERLTARVLAAVSRCFFCRGETVGHTNACTHVCETEGGRGFTHTRTHTHTHTHAHTHTRTHTLSPSAVVSAMAAHHVVVGLGRPARAQPLLGNPLVVSAAANSQQPTANSQQQATERERGNRGGLRNSVSAPVCMRLPTCMSVYVCVVECHRHKQRQEERTSVTVLSTCTRAPSRSRFACNRRLANM